MNRNNEILPEQQIALKPPRVLKELAQRAELKQFIRFDQKYFLIDPQGIQFFALNVFKFISCEFTSGISGKLLPLLS